MDYDGWIVFYIVCVEGNIEVVKFLLKYGVFI